MGVPFLYARQHAFCYFRPGDADYTNEHAGKIKINKGVLNFCIYIGAVFLLLVHPEVYITVYIIIIIIIIIIKIKIKALFTLKNRSVEQK